MAETSSTALEPVEAPAELFEMFLPKEEVSFELLRTVGSVRLWRSTAKREPYPDPCYPGVAVRYHVTVGARPIYMHMSHLEDAAENFQLAACKYGKAAGITGPTAGAPQ